MWNNWKSQYSLYLYNNRNIFSAIGPPKFKKQMEDATAMLDEDVVFSVDIEGSPEPTVSW